MPCDVGKLVREHRIQVRRRRIGESCRQDDARSQRSQAQWDRALRTFEQPWPDADLEPIAELGKRHGNITGRNWICVSHQGPRGSQRQQLTQRQPNRWSEPDHEEPPPHRRAVRWSGVCRQKRTRDGRSVRDPGCHRSVQPLGVGVCSRAGSMIR